MKKDDALQELEKPKLQRSPGLMAHLTCSAHDGGALLKPHFVPRGQMMGGPYYANALESDVLRQIEVAVGGRDYYFQQDLASAHTSQVAKGLLQKEGVRLAPWLPSGADIAPLGAFVNHAAKESLRGKDLSNLAKLRAETNVASAKLSADSVFRGQLQKARRAFEKRIRWAAANGGRKVSRKSANENWYAWRKHFAPEDFVAEQEAKKQKKSKSAKE